MSDPIKTYTYRGGEKIELTKSTDEFVVAASAEILRDQGFTRLEPVSPTANRVGVLSSEMEVAMARARYIAPTHHAYSISDTGQEFLISDRIFVTFREGVIAAQIDAFMGQYALLLVEKYSDREYLFRLTNHTEMNPVKLLRKLIEEEPVVEAADHDLYYRVQKYAFQLPSDQYYQNQWHLHTHFQHAEFDPRSSSRCEDAWRLLDGVGDQDVVIGITDDGCQMSHADFDSPNKFAGWAYWEPIPNTDMGYLFTDHSVGAVESKMYVPGQNHGTACAGVAAAESDAVLTVGAAPGCRLLPVRYISSGSTLFIGDSILYQTLKYVSNRVDVLSNSWGGAPLNLFAPMVVQLIRDLAVSGGRRGRGILFLWAAGNENCPINHDSTTAAPYTNGWAKRADLTGQEWIEWIGVQAAFRFRNELVGIPGVVHVAALASTAQRSHYSNYGSGIDLCAPTNNSHSYYRNTVRGLHILTASGEGNPQIEEEFGGTSSATPLVAGVAALVISANPDLTALEVESILKRTASKDLDFQGYPRTAPAVYDPNPVWDVSPVPPFDNGAFQDIGDPDGTWSPWFGHGRVDAAAAVAEALRLRAAGQAQAQTTSSTSRSRRRSKASGG